MTRQKFNELVRTHPIKDIVEGWFFEVDEVSNGAYFVEGMNIEGNVVSRMGSDPDELIIACKIYIDEIMK